MANKRVKLEWKEVEGVARLNQQLKPYMKEAIDAQIRYNDFKEMLLYPNEPNGWTDWWGEWKSRKYDEIDGLYFQTEEAVKEAYNESRVMKFKYEEWIRELQN
jgi:hypothetical protein